LWLNKIENNGIGNTHRFTLYDIVGLIHVTKHDINIKQYRSKQAAYMTLNKLKVFRDNEHVTPALCENGKLVFILRLYRLGSWRAKSRR